MGDEDNWNEYAYIVDSCQVTAWGTNVQRSAKLTCDEVEGLTLELYDDLFCEGTLVSETSYLEGNDSCHSLNDSAPIGTYRRLMECVDRSNETQPDWITP